MSKVWRFLDSNGGAWTVRDLGRRLYMSPSAVRRELLQLRDEGLIEARRDGDRWVYQARRWQRPLCCLELAGQEGPGQFAALVVRCTRQGQARCAHAFGTPDGGSVLRPGSSMVRASCWLASRGEDCPSPSTPSRTSRTST
jgi:hypothetical protein